jgi:hypothetical protein
MPHASVKLIPGVDQRRTPALNEAGISESNLIRFVPDRQGYGLVQKLGGWTKFYPNPTASIVRTLWAWQDTNAIRYLAVGAQSSLEYITEGTRYDITPRDTTRNEPVDISTVSGSNIVTIVDVGSNITDYDDVYIQTPISVGGIVLFGLYTCINPTVLADEYQIAVTDVLGLPVNATSTVNNGGTIVNFSTTAGSPVVEVALDDHGYSVGSTFPIIVSTAIGGITLFGNFIVSTVIDPNTFTIIAKNLATTTVANQDMNSGDARYKYFIGQGPVPAGTGYGVGGYGEGGYGSGIPPQPEEGTPITTADWTLDNWGEILISCPLNGAIYEWSPLAGYNTSSVIGEAPIVNAGIVTAMPQRQIIAWGSTFTGIQDPLLIRWCDVDNFLVWEGLVSNQAGSYRIPKGSKIIQCIQGPQQTLVWTDVNLWAMQYVGPPYVYQFNEIGSGCGLIGRKAATSLNGVVYWMGPSQFYRLAGSGVEAIACPVWDVIFQDLDTNNLDKIRIAPNSRFGEISWFYPTAGNGGEPNKYVKYNIALDQWDYGTLERTAWINESVLGPPIGSGPLPGGGGYYIVQHETSPDAVNASGNPIPINASFQTGYFVMNEADVKMFVDQVWPDMKWGYYDGSQSAQVNLTFYITDFAGQTPLEYGPYAMTVSTDYITPRFRGRLVSIKMESNDVGSFWRIGNMRYRLQPDGKF